MLKSYLKFISILFIFLFLPFFLYAQELSLQLALPDEKVVIPMRGLVYSSDDIRDIRRTAQSSSAYRKVVNKKLKAASKWLSFSDERIIALFPPKEALYAYGIAGDPETDEQWSRFGEKGICQLDRPYEVISPKTGHIFGTQKKGERFYDNGKGWHREDGSIFYFKGIWYAYVIRQMHKAVDELAYAYLLTGDKRVAKKALLIFDFLAMLRPLSDEQGPIDNRHGKNWGFMSYGGNLANQRMLDSVLAFDLLGNTASAKLPSFAHDNLTIFENIKRNYFDVFEQRNYGFSVPNLQNHQQARLMNLLAQGILFGKPEDIRFGIEALYTLLNNTTDRDGEYYEVSGSYSNTGRYYISRMIDVLSHYNQNNYNEPTLFPVKEDYPYQLRFGNHPQWYQLLIKPLYQTEVVGRMPNYGDSSVDRQETDGKLNRKVAWRRKRFLSKFYFQTDNSAWKAEVLTLYQQLPENIARQIELSDFKKFEDTAWQGLASESVKSVFAENTKTSSSVMLGGKVIGVLRSGEAKEQRAIFMRGGVNSSHAHDDQMAIILYAKGMEASGEFGYALYARPDHLGFGVRAIAHNTVVVNEDITWLKEFHKLYKTTPAADVLAFLPEGSAQLVELSSPNQWQHVGVSEYRRAITMVDVSEEDFYTLDVFHVKGGKTHDYVWNARYWDNATKENDGLTVSDVELQANPDVWTLAALNENYMDTTFNKPGQSWGERLRPDGSIQNLDIPGEKLAYRGWNPPPGNGYGFAYNVKTALTDKSWSATWLLGDKANNKMRMMMLSDEPQQVIKANTPSRHIDKHHAVMIARKKQEAGKPLSSQFVNLVQVASDDNWPVVSAKQIVLKSEQGGEDNLAVVVQLKDGRKDVLLFANDQSEKIYIDGIAMQGKYGFVRFSEQGQLTELRLYQGKSLSVNGTAVKFKQAVQSAKVIKVMDTLKGTQIQISIPLKEGTSLIDSTAIVTSGDATQPYSHNEYFRIEGIINDDKERAIIDLGLQRLSLGKTEVETVDVSTGIITVRWPLTLGFSKPAREFDGRELLVTNDKSRKTTIISFEGQKKLKVLEPERLKPGDIIDVRTIREGDFVTIPAFVILSKDEKNNWSVQSNQTVQVNLE